MMRFGAAAACWALTACGTPSPVIESVAPESMCGTSADTVRIVGDGFATAVYGAYDDEPKAVAPTVQLIRAGDLAGDAVESRIENVDPSVVHHIDARQIDLVSDAGLGVGSGSWHVQVTNPMGGEAQLDDAILVAGGAELTDVMPPAICANEPTVITRITGEGLLHIGGVWPDVRIAGIAQDVVGGVNCRPLAGGRDGEVCDGIDVQVRAEGLPIGSSSIQVDNPDPLSCGTDALSYEILLPSEVTSITPQEVCSSGATLTIRGTNLLEGTTVSVGGTPIAAVRYLDDDTMEVDLPDDLPLSAHDVTVTPPQGCPVTVPNAVQVASGAVLYAVMPEAVWSGEDVGVAAFSTDLKEPLTRVWLEADDGTSVDVHWSWDPIDPGRIDLTVPKGLDEGSWSVEFSQDGDCPAVSSASVQVSAATSIPLQSVRPNHAWRFGYTPVEVRTKGVAEAGEELFADPPRLYLVGPDDDPSSYALQAVHLRWDAMATALVPPDIPEGTYDLMALNPDGSTGWMADAVTVNGARPPAITGVAPATLPNRSDEPIRLSGTGFDDPTVSLFCREDGATSTVFADVTSWDPYTIHALVPADRFHTAVCVVAVQNADGAMGRFSAVSITNPAQNITPWQRSSDLVHARRGPSLVAGRTTPVTRWVYAIGGDKGDLTDLHSTMEVAPIGLFGDIGEWTEVPRPLHRAMTLGGAGVIGDFIYVVAGFDGTTSARSTYRAEILDPTQVPRFTTLTVRDLSGKPTGGVWRYRISAVFPADDRNNPGGESLPSEPIVLDLPEGLVPMIRWTEVSGASGYRVYRSPTAGSAPGSEVLLKEVPGANYTDWGFDEPDASRTPLTPGSVGSWRFVANLDVGRTAPCVAFVQDPLPDPERWWIYVAGGTDADGEPLDSVEALDIEIRGGRNQVAGRYRDAGVRLSEARHSCGAYVVDHKLHDEVEPAEAWVYFAGGDTGRKTSAFVDAGQVGRGGGLEDWGRVESMAPARAGFASASASNFLYAFGGQHGRPSGTSASARVIEGAPTLQNWNSLAEQLVDDKLYAGSMQESAVLVIAGGTDPDNDATRTVQWTNW